jgi:hypothetical protein
MASTPALDLTTTRPVIKIDGTEYTLKKPGDLSFLAYQHRAREFDQVGRVLQAKRPKPAEVTRATAILRELCAYVVSAPPTVLDKLDDLQRVEIVTHFFSMLTRRMGQRPPSVNGRPSRSAPSSRG